jgi:DNA polymerase-1
MSFTPRPIKQGDHVVLVDGSSYIFRAYHALPPLTRKSDGLPVGAVSGFCNMLWKLMREKVDGERPTHLAVIFDASASTFRNTLFDQYKADRPEAPSDLKPQFRLIREAVRAFDIPCLEQDGWEADDLIATYVCRASDVGATVTIVASDKDLMQLVRPGVVMYDSMKEKRIDEVGVLEKFGVPPEKVVDVQALAGDSIDNVPGVPGIGIKTAAQLINEYGDLETLLDRAAEIKQPKRREALIAFAEQARMSKKLVKLECDVPLKHPIDELGIHEPHPTRLVSFLRAMEFYALMRRVAAAYEVQADEIEPDPRLLPGARRSTGAAPRMRITCPSSATKTRPRQDRPTAATTSRSRHRRSGRRRISAPRSALPRATLPRLTSLSRWTLTRPSPPWSASPNGSRRRPRKGTWRST